MIETHVLSRGELPEVDAVLPLHRFDGWRDDSTYLVAWDDGVPVGHIHIAWSNTELGVPELQDVFVPADRRGQGIGTELTRAAEQLAAARGHDRCSLSVSDANAAARRLYERLGYVPAEIEPRRIAGTITIRGEQVEVDDTLVYLVKVLDRPAGAVDFAAGRSS